MANKYFNAAYYLQNNLDIMGSGYTAANAESHYLQYGAFEAAAGAANRKPAPWFDVKFYLQSNPDLLTANLSAADAFHHFTTYGINEGRSPSAGVKLDAANMGVYAAANADLRTAFGIADGATPTADQVKALANHFYQFGYSEARPGSPADVVVNPGQTFTLTTGVDNIVGTAGNDSVLGAVSFTDSLTPVASGTYSAADQIDGGAGIDALSLTVDGGGATYTTGALAVASIKNVEKINIRAVQTDAADIVSLNAGAISGVTAVNSDRSTSAVTVTGLATGASAGVIGDGTVVNGALSFAYATATDAVTLNLSGGTKGTAAISNTGTGATAATINSTGAANSVGTVTLAATGTVKTLNVNADANLTATSIANLATDAAVTVKGGAASVNVGTLTNVKTIDASGLTNGGLTATLVAGTTSVKGGQGADVITTAATTATGAVIDAGAGTDTLILAAGHDVTTAAKGAQYVNFETLRLNASQDVSLVAGITALELNAMSSGVISKISAAQSAAITVKGDQGTALTLTLADATGSADAVSLALKGATATANVDVAALSVIGVETLNVAATTGTAGTSSDVTFATGGADKLTAINLSGTADVGLVGTNTAKAVTVVSTTTGVATISGNFVDASSITTGAGKDVITLGTGFGTYNSGAGDDTFNATAAQLNTGAKYNVINGGEGTDTLNIIGGVALAIVDNNLSKISGVEKIVIADTTTFAQTIQTGGFFDAAFKTTGVDLATTATTGNITIDMTSFSGAATLKTTSAAGAVSIKTGSSGGNDKVTVNETTGTVSVDTAAGDDVVSVTTTTGVQTISTGAGNDTITSVATAGTVTTITAGAGADKITLGAGADTIVIGNTDSGITLATADTIIGFTSGTDKLSLGFAGGATNATEAAAAVVDFATALTNANAALAGLKVANPAVTEFANFQWDATNGYLFNDTNADGTADQVIVLVGINGGSFAVGDIVA